MSYNRRVAMQVWYEKQTPRVAVFVVNHLKGRECIRVYHQATHASVQRITKHFENVSSRVNGANRIRNQMVRIEWEVE